MSTETPAIATPTAPAAAPPQRGPAPIPSTAEILAQLSAASTAPNLSFPANPTAGAASAETAPSSPPNASELSPKNADDVSLARIAQEQRRIDGQKKALAEERKRLTGAAADGEAYRALKTSLGVKGERGKAIIALLGEDAFKDAYFELTDEVLAREATETPDTRVERAVAKKLEEARKADADAKARSDADAAAANDTQVNQAQSEFITGIAQTYQKSVDKYPALSLFPVSGEDILAYTRDQYKTKGAIPSDGDILGHFESATQEKLEKLRPAAATAGIRTVTNGMRNDVTGRPAKEMTLAEITAEAKRAAGIV